MITVCHLSVSYSSVCFNFITTCLIFSVLNMSFMASCEWHLNSTNFGFHTLYGRGMSISCTFLFTAMQFVASPLKSWLRHWDLPPISSHYLILFSTSPPLLNYNKQKTNKQTNKNTLNKNKNILFKSHQLYWIDLLKKNGNRSVPMLTTTSWMTLYHLSKAQYINHIFLVWWHRHSVILKTTDFKTSTILVCMILNGKGSPTGCGLHFFFNRSIQYSWLFSNKTFLLMCKLCCHAVANALSRWVQSSNLSWLYSNLKINQMEERQSCRCALSLLHIGNKVVNLWHTPNTWEMVKCLQWLERVYDDQIKLLQQLVASHPVSVSAFNFSFAHAQWTSFLLMKGELSSSYSSI